jgi:cell division septum initiation protein DivIVA
LLLVAVTVAGALALLAAVFLTRRRPDGLPAGDRMLAVLDEQDARLAALQAGLLERREERARALASPPARCDMVILQPPPDTGLASEPSEGHMGEVDHAANEAVGDAEVRNYGDIGNRVDKILAAAEQAAEQIRADAQEEAAAIRRRAEEASAARLQQLERETEQLRAEADSYARDTRQTGDSYASQQRRQAEEEVNRMLEEAETQARATREAAEVMAQRIEADARAGQVQLREHAKTVHVRMQRAAAGLRDMAEQMEELLQAQLREAGDDSLVEALDPQGRRVPQS